MFKYLLIFLFFLVSGSVEGQNWIWATGTESPDDEYGNYSDGIAIDAQGFLYITGKCLAGTSFQSLTAGTEGLFIAQYDNQGVIQWLRIVPNAHPLDIKAAGPQNRISIVGVFKDTCDFGFGEFISDNWSPFTVQYDSDGNSIWAKPGYNTSFSGCYNESVDIDGAGNTVVVGSTRGETNFDGLVLGESLSGSGYILKYDSNGNLIDHVEYVSGNSSSLSRSAELSCDPQNNVIITGSFRDSITFSGLTFTTQSSQLWNENSDIYLAKFNSTLDLEWVRQFVGTVDSIEEYPTGLAVNDNFIYLTGACANNTDFGGVSTSITQQAAIFWSKFNSDGTPIWVKTSSGFSMPGKITTGNSDETFMSFIADELYGTFGTDSSNRNINIAKVDSLGTVDWIAKGTSNHRGGFCCEGVTDLIWQDGSVYSTGILYEEANFENIGISSIPLSHIGHYSVFVAKIGDDGLLPATSGQQEIFLHSEPSTRTLFVKGTEEIKTLRVFDLLGQIVLEQESILSSQFSVDISRLASALYVAEALMINGETVSEKFIVKRD